MTIWKPDLAMMVEILQVNTVAYAFDVERNGIVLVAGDKGGKNQRKFYE